VEGSFGQVGHHGMALQAIGHVAVLALPLYPEITTRYRGFHRCHVGFHYGCVFIQFV
jgi:hypothetical protein